MLVNRIREDKSFWTDW